MSSIAVFLILGGATALAASHLGKNSVGTKQLKKNAVTSAKIKKNAVTAAKIKNGSVTSAKLKAGAVTAAQIGAGAVTNEKLAGGSVSGDKIANGAVGGAQLAANSVGNGQTQLVKVFKGGPVPAVGDEASSPRIELGSVGPFRFYGKCFTAAGEVTEKTYIELTGGTAVLGSEDAANFHNNTEGYLTPATPENKRALEDEAVAEADSFNAESSDEEFQASASDGTEITGEAAGTGAKQGNPPEGNGPFLAGDSCIVGTIAIFGS
jgi:hypothetical protein